MAKFYAKMRFGKGSTIVKFLLAVVCPVNSCYVSNHTIIIFIAAGGIPELITFISLQVAAFF